MIGFIDLLFITFFSISLLFCLFSYINIDPMKCSFFLIFSLILITPLISFGSHIWFSYFICLLFLSGIFVILVYFSSISGISYKNLYGGYLIFLFSVCYMFFFGFSGDYLSLEIFYYNIYFFVLLYIFFLLLYFINFRSYFLRFSGALRKL